MSLIEYDVESDALYISVSRKKAFYSLELSQNIIVDLADSNAVGVEFLNASKFLSEVFHANISKNDLKKLHCSVNDEKSLNLNFELNNEKASVILPKSYESPILSVN